jgi:flagellin
MLHTKEGALNETHAILQRMKTLAAQASNGTLSEEDRKLINIEYKSLMDEIDRIYTSTNFNTKPVMDPEDLDAFTPDKNTLDEGKRLRDTDILTQDNAKEAMDFLDKVIVSVAASRAGIGAQVNVLEHRISYLGTMSLCLEDSLSTIEDADIAKEMMEFTKASILSQVAQAMMAHTMNDAHMIVTMLSAM